MKFRATNQDIAEVFTRISQILDIQGENSFRVRAYERAGQTFAALGKEAGDIYAAGGREALEEISSVGPDLAQKTEELLKTGKLKALTALQKKIPKGLLEVMGVEGMGPKHTKLVWKKFGVKNIKDLERLVASGKLSKLKGWGEKSVANIARGIDLAKNFGERVPLPAASATADAVVRRLLESGLCDRAVVGGSIRRMRETVKDIDILVTTKKPKAVMDLFVSLPFVKTLIARGDTKVNVLLKMGIEADLRVLEPDCFGAGLYYFTGSREHNVAVRAMALKKKLTISEYGVFRGTKEHKGKRIAGKTEEEVFASVGLPYISPELREGRGEIEAALAGSLPKLVEIGDIKGDLHLHSSFSDGVDDMAVMADAAKKAGLSYIAITDHGSMIGLVKGIKEHNLNAYLKKIEAVREKVHGIHILAGSEVDIRDDGSLFLSNDALKRLDWVVASVHSSFRQSEEVMTKRIVRAIGNPYVSMIGHPTARLLSGRSPILFNTKTVFVAAAKRGVAVEVSASPERLDLNDAHARAAHEAGVMLAISSDAHAKEQFDFRFGVGQARRAWLTKKDIINAHPWESFSKTLKKRK